MRKRRCFLAMSALALVLLTVWGVPGIPARAATPSFYTNRATFEAAIGSPVTDDYCSPPYPAGFGIYTDAEFSAFLGETDYHSTGFADRNLHLDTDSYCAGCNASFELSFQTSSATLLGIGVYGVGLDILQNSPQVPYHAFITYGDGTTEDRTLPQGASFFGVTALELIESIHFGGSGGDSTTDGMFVIDNLTIGLPPYSHYVPLCTSQAGG